MSWPGRHSLFLITCSVRDVVPMKKSTCSWHNDNKTIIALFAAIPAYGSLESHVL